MSNHELEAKVRDLREMQALIEEAEAEAENIKDAIKAHMGNNEELRAGEYKITWKMVKSSKLDLKALKQALPDVHSAFTRESVSRRFCVV